MKTADDIFFDGLKGSKKEAQEPAPEPKKEPEEPAIKPITQKNLFANAEVHPLVLDLVLLKNFHVEWFSWIPETLFREIELTFKTSIAEVNRVKIMAVQSMHVVDSFWEQWEVFEKTILALNGLVPRVDLIQPLDIPQMMAGVDIANLVRKEEFGDEVGRYAAACFHHENVQYAPEPMSFCQPYISQPMYTCEDCGKKASALLPWDGMCEACTLRFDQDTPFSFRPDPERVAKGFGQRVKVAPTYEFEAIKKRFDEMEKTPPDQLEIKEVAEDIQGAKLIVAFDYMNLRRKQYVEQITALGGWLEAS